MGGPMGVYEVDRHPFLRQEIKAIRRFIDAGKPVLGVCLGAQLTAAALGADVYPNKKKEIGWYPIDLTPEGKKDPLFADFNKRETVFQWHGDTFDLPPGAVPLAESPLCRNQAFRWGDKVYGLQFHIEVSIAMIRDWLAQPGAEAEVGSAGPGALSRLKEKLPARTKAMSRLAEDFIDKFRELL
jgi:GMP synthase-like glutamine amidotransferase